MAIAACSRHVKSQGWIAARPLRPGHLRAPPTDAPLGAQGVLIVTMLLATHTANEINQAILDLCDQRDDATDHLPGKVLKILSNQHVRKLFVHRGAAVLHCLEKLHHALAGLLELLHAHLAACEPRAGGAWRRRDRARPSRKSVRRYSTPSARREHRAPVDRPV